MQSFSHKRAKGSHRQTTKKTIHSVSAADAHLTHWAKHDLTRWELEAIELIEVLSHRPRTGEAPPEGRPTSKPPHKWTEVL